MKTTACQRYTCFGCKGGTCKVLRETITGKPCPFYKTAEQLESERNEVLERLEAAGRTDLIKAYAANLKAYAI